MQADEMILTKGSTLLYITYVTMRTTD